MSPAPHRPLRRAVLCAAVLGFFGGCATAQPVRAASAVALAPGVYVVHGSPGVADENNLGRIGNAGFIVGSSGVVAIDTGTSYAHGEALLAAIARVTELPVRVALVSHTRPEFLFGGAAFRARGIPVRMHRRTAGLMASRCKTCLDVLRQTLGDEPMRGTTMYSADQVFDATHELDGVGRPVRVLHFGHSSGPGDIAVLDVTSGVLFAGGLLDARRIPDIHDSDLAGWKSALQALRALGPRTVVPGHGASSSPQVIDIVERYLVQLETRVRAMVAAGDSLLGAADAAELPDFDAWDQYDTIHRRNVSIAFVRFERDLLFK
ncbi:MAG TPA: MBL fold metallo-hydrolase [Burkholderiaceae bacterium]|nr:MBL fold metallo-hydrolase [Burkholderiaceae bacterium]